ncbi:hypothetical protein Tsubulata_030793 [Turnera subulata]|uniref:Protein kinase domain-containing protein n=1 Tax=Turnera subulata TaxID=218843 RepID=A0A9Q0FA42_9ROSI|nr:hypothetical protein Tsubulata_030793 [Turnera subulata]
MGCICSRSGEEEDGGSNDNEKEKEIKVDKSSVQLVAPVQEESLKDGSRGAGRRKNVGKVDPALEEGEKKAKADKPQIIRTTSMSLRPAMGQSVWPQWLISVAEEAVKGWVPRRADSFEKLEKIGQGTYSTVYKARDLESGKIVAMKKVRFVNMDPESVRFMAREIQILRKLDHPNVMKLEGIVTSRMSGNLYLVFEYMEHDLAGLAARPGVKFTEPQIKCYMKQLLSGLEHCHRKGVLHRDIKGSNLLIGDNGVLKIGDFGLATFFQPNQNQAMTSRVVTLWYRAPELLLGATEYGAAIDMWSAGCILAELLAGKPIMPGRTEVEQMHKIFKLCGSPSEEYWKNKKLPHATSFKPQQPYKRRTEEVFKNFPPAALALVDKLLAMEPEDRGSATAALGSEFFRTEPLACDPSSLPKYPPSKEQDAKLREEEARRQRAEKAGRGPESVRGPRVEKATSPSTSYKYDIQEDVGAKKNGFSHCCSMIHPSSLTKHTTSHRNNQERSQKTHLPQATVDVTSTSLKKDEKDHSSMGYVPRKTRIHYSGPLMPPGGNIEDVLREHERQIQEAVRKARVEKNQ